MEVTARTTCRVCGSSNLTPLFSLGEQYISDFVAKEDIYNGIKAPLDLEQCNDCTLVQLKHTAPQELLYERYYWYRSGVTQTMRDALQDAADTATKVANLEIGDSVLDIGSNDGTLLRAYKMNVHKVGVEPALNMQKCGGRNFMGQLSTGFWGDTKDRSTFNSVAKWDIGRSDVDRKYKIVTALGMFYDLDDPNPFIADVAKVLHKDGVFIAQLMCLKNMLNVCDVGNICHEHLEYYTLESLNTLYWNNGLCIYDVQKNNVNGESYRIFACHRDVYHDRVKSDLSAHDRTESAFVDEVDIFNDDLPAFFNKIRQNKSDVVQFIKGEVARGKKVWVYGASTKGNVLLQYWGLDHTLITGAAERSPEKWGKYTIGTGIRIYDEDTARASADYFLVLPYAFINEFVEREAKWRTGGGKFIVPLPELRII